MVNIHSQNLHTSLIDIVKLVHLFVPLYIPKDDEQVPMASHYKNDENGNLMLSPQDCIEIHNKYKQLYLNTKQIHGNGQRRNLEKSKSPPQVINLLSNRSRDMAIKKKNNLNINEWFAQQEQKKKENIEKLKSQLEQQQQDETKELKSTIKPVAIDLTQLSKPVKKQQDKSTIDVEFENQQQFCTFSPQINPMKHFPISTASTQYDIDQQAKRLREARLRQKTLEKLKNTGNTTNNESRTQIKLQTEQSMSQEPKCKKIKSKPIFLNFPILYIDVKIDDAKTVRLPVFNGDNSENLATKFAIDHSTTDSLALYKSMLKYTCQTSKNESNSQNILTLFVKIYINYLKIQTTLLRKDQKTYQRSKQILYKNNSYEIHIQFISKLLQFDYQVLID